MTSPLWSLVDFAARPLRRDERDAVLGDALEAGDTPWQTLAGILGLVFRRQALPWKSWRPWFAVFIFGVPSTLLLMYVSVSVAFTFDRLMGLKVSHWAPTGHEGFAMLLCHICLLITWSWTSGFTLGSLSPRTLWTNVILFLLLAQYFHRMCIFAAPVQATHGAIAGGLPFHISFLALAQLSPFLFVMPAIWGIHQGVHTARLTQGHALLLAIIVTILTTAAWTSSALWVVNWLLICPAWYLVATARRSGGKRDRPGTHQMQRPVRT